MLTVELAKMEEVFVNAEGFQATVAFTCALKAPVTRGSLAAFDELVAAAEDAGAVNVRVYVELISVKVCV